MPAVANSLCLLGLAIGALSSAASCTLIRDETTAVAAADKWIRMLEEGRFEDAWDAGSNNCLKKATSKPAWAKGWREYSATLGPARSRRIVETQYLAQNRGLSCGPIDTVGIYYEVHFANRGQARVSATVVRDSDGMWRVVYYTVYP